MRGAGRGLRRPGLRPDRCGKDGRRRVRRAQGAGRGAQGVLHDPDQGAVEPEVRRPRRALRAGQGRSAHRRQRHQRRRPGGRDDHRGAAEHALRRVPGDRRPRLRGHGRGALPRRPVPRRGVGGGDHPPAAVGHPGLAVGDGEQRRGVRRVAGHRARPHEGRGQRGPAGAALAAHAGRQPRLRPVLAAARRPRRGAGGHPPRTVHPRARGIGRRSRARPARARVRAADRGLGRQRQGGWSPRLPQAALPPAGPLRRRRAPRPRRPAARDHLRVQPQRLRRRRPPVPARGSAAHR